MASQNSGFTGSEIMFPAVQANGEANQSMVPAPPSAPLAAPPHGGFQPQGPEILHGPFSQMWLVNCLRRRWLPALLLGFLCAVASAGLLLWLFPLSSKVVSYLEVKARPPVSVFGQQQRTTPQEYEIYQQTQLALFKSQFVLNAALSRKDIAQLDAVFKEGENAQLWLWEELKASFPGQGEILEIRYDGGEDPREMVKVVDAVVDAFRNEVLYTGRARASETRDKLIEFHKQEAKKLRGKMDQYEKLAQSLGDPDSPIATTVLGMLTGEVRMIQQQIIQAKRDLIEIEVAKTLAIQKARSITALEEAVQEELANDPTIASYQEDQYGITQTIRELRSMTKRSTSPDIRRWEERAQQVAQELQQYRVSAEAELRNRLKSKPNDELAQMMTEYQLRRKSILDELAQLEEEKEVKMDRISQKGDRSATLSLLKVEIEQLQEVESSMNMRIRSWDVEEETAQDRITVLKKATATENINEFERYAIASLGGLAAFCATCYCIALIEFRRRRLNGPSDVDEGLGIRVLGVLPSVSSRRAMAPGSPIAAQLSESIDSVRATLMHDSTLRPRQVVLVTSPATMEGCTTVASHLALSLTRAGRRTLLIDGDLREPSLHKLFGMPLGDGLSEVLRSEMDISDAIRPTNTEGLWLLTAGQCDMDAVHALATDQPQPIFEKLRAEFDFVVIDGAPVLSMSDTLSIGQHVDGAILTVLRDHSEIRGIHQASELLRSMGICVIGSVVNGVSMKADRRVARLHLAAAKQPRKLPAGIDG